MPIHLGGCPACSSTCRIVYSHTAVFDPSYPTYGVAFNNCLLRDVLLTDSIERSLMRCSTCGLYFISPSFTPEELGRLYGSARMQDHCALVKSNAPSPYAHISNPRFFWDAEAAHSAFIYRTVTALRRDLSGLVVVDIGGQYAYHLRYFLQAGAVGYVQDFVR